MVMPAADSSAASRLCTACGMCCNGVMFHTVRLQPRDLAFNYKEAYATKALPEAYERLILDCIQGDASLFMRSDEIERAWEIMDPLIAAAERIQPEEYAVGSDGAAGADAYLARSGRSWLSLCHHE